jgi:hypothetical protein
MDVCHPVWVFVILSAAKDLAFPPSGFFASLRTTGKTIAVPARQIQRVLPLFTIGNTD